MTTYFIRRLLLIIPTFLGVTMIAFLITRMVPGGPLERAVMEARMAAGGWSESGGQLPESVMEELKKTYHLDKPWYQAYFLWLNDVAHLSLGNSHKYREPVASLIAERFPISLMFGLSGFVLAYLISIPLGILKALRHGSPFDFASSAMVFIGYSIPGWAMGTLLLVFFAGGEFYEWFPLGKIQADSFDGLPSIVQRWEDEDSVSDEFGSFSYEKISPISRLIDRLHHAVLPVFCYVMGSFAALTILMKNSLMENLGQDYVRTAFAKGVSPRRVILIHTLRNSLIPIATGLGHAIGIIMAGSYLIELTFEINGMGMLGYNAIIDKDFTVVMGILAVNILLTLFGNILSDFFYAAADPRIRFE